jgi:hypothetical protein
MSRPAAWEAGENAPGAPQAMLFAAFSTRCGCDTP